MRAAYDVYFSPIGPIHVLADEMGVKRVFMTPEHWDEYKEKYGGIPRDKAMCHTAISELDEYFSGKRRVFTVPLSIEGTEFCKKVWRELLSIPYGKTCSYGEIAAAVGSPKGSRAVGQANRKNPVPIFIPCHRVVGKSGELTGYLGDNTGIKKYLLDLESPTASPE